MIKPSFLLIACLISPFLQAAEFEIKQYDLNINIFQDKAFLSRNTTLKIPKGTHTLIYPKIPQQLKLDNVSLQADNQLNILEMTLQKTQLPELNKQLEQIKLELNTIDVLLQGVSANERKVRQLTTKRLELQKTQDQLMRQLNSALNYELRITINAQQALNTPIVLNYVNEESYWQADYEANYQQGQLSLALYANIYNRTAENWENAKIQLSTAKTQATLPATPIWQIGTQQGAIVAYAAPALYQNKASFSRANAQSNEQAFSK